MYIRPFKNADIEAVFKIFHSKRPKYFVAGEESGLRDFLQQGLEHYYVAEIDGEIVASGGIALNEDDTVSLCWKRVRADHLGTGLGKTLPSFRIKKASEHLGAFRC